MTGTAAPRRTAWQRAAGLGIAAALALCLALPSLLCRTEIAALERGHLTRPALESTLSAEGQADPLARVLYQGRTLFGSGSQPLELDQTTIAQTLYSAVQELFEAGVVSGKATTLSGELAQVRETATAARRDDGTLQYDGFAYSGYLMQMVWQPDLAKPVELMLAHAMLPAADPDELLAAWRTYLGEESGSWQTECPDPDTRLCYCADRQLLLTAYSAEGTLAVRAYSLSSQDWQALLDQLRQPPQEAAP